MALHNTMNKLLFVIAATTSSLFVMLPVKYARAADLGFTVVENYANQSSTPTSSGLYLYQNLVSAQGQVTSINGFSSLQGVNPNSLTFNFGNLQLLNYQELPNNLTEFFGNNGQQTPFFNLFENGQVIASSNNITMTIVSTNNSSVPITQKIDIALNEISGSPFFQEVKQLSNGTGILEFTATTPNEAVPSGSFVFTGNASIKKTVTSVPESSSPLLDTLVVSLWGTGYLLKLKLTNKLT